MVARRSNVEHYELVGTFDVITRRKRGRVSSVTQINKLHAFDDALAIGI
jgi:hypothetical protein